MEELIGYTTTWRPPTESEEEKEIVKLAKKIRRKKWYEFEERYVLRKKMMGCVDRINIQNKCSQ